MAEQDEHQQDGALLALYQRLAALRKATPALRCGACQVLYAEGDVVIFLRVLGAERVLVAINRGDAAEVTLADSPLLAVSGWQRREGEGQLAERTLTLAAISATVWTTH